MKKLEQENGWCTIEGDLAREYLKTIIESTLGRLVESGYDQKEVYDLWDTVKRQVDEEIAMPKGDEDV